MLWLSRILTDYDLDDALLLFVIDAYIILDDFVFVYIYYYSEPCLMGVSIHQVQ